jgi:hypothetical protein
LNGHSTDRKADIPSLNKKSRETGELQDMYRRSLAAFWTAQPGELKADECIEDIFAGGDGWGDKDKPYPTQPTQMDDSGSYSDDEATIRRPHSSHHHRRRHHGHKFTTGFSKGMGGPKSRGTGGAVRGRTSLEQSVKNMKADAARHGDHAAVEVDELDVRDDLRSWNKPK